jgi:hypothetical protein
MVAKGRNGTALHPESILRGEQIYNAKLTASQVREIRMRRSNGEICRLIGIDYGVSKETIEAICAGRHWRHVD